MLALTKDGFQAPMWKCCETTQDAPLAQMKDYGNQCTYDEMAVLLLTGIAIPPHG